MITNFDHLPSDEDLIKLESHYSEKQYLLKRLHALKKFKDNLYSNQPSKSRLIIEDFEGTEKIDILYDLPAEIRETIESIIDNYVDEKIQSLYNQIKE